MVLISGKRLLAAILMLLVISFGMLSAQDSERSEDYGKLFEEIPSPGPDESDEKTGFDLLDAETTVSLLGRHIFRYSIPVDPDHFDYTGLVKSPRALNDLGLEVQHRGLKLISHWRFATIAAESGDWPDFFTVTPLENAITFSKSILTVRLGFQYFTWGVADGLNPTDNVNPRDFGSSIEAEKIPLFALAGSLYPSDFISLELVYVPFEQNDLLPAAVEENIPFSMAAVTKEKLNFSPQSVIAGAKLNLFLSSFDFSASYLYDIDPNYSPNIKGFSLTPPYEPTEITLKRRRIHRLGLDAKIILDRVALWLESCFSITEDHRLKADQIRNPNLAWTSGFDFHYGPEDSYYLSLQSTGRWVLDFYRDSLDPTRLTDQPYKHAHYSKTLAQQLGGEREGLFIGFATNMQWSLLNSTLVPSCTAVYMIPFLYDDENDTRYGSLVLRPELDIVPLDSLHILLGADLAFAWHKKRGDDTVGFDTDDLVGRLFEHNNVYLKVEYSWTY